MEMRGQQENLAECEFTVLLRIERILKLLPSSGRKATGVRPSTGAAM
jgi:hypothetical protein